MVSSLLLLTLLHLHHSEAQTINFPSDFRLIKANGKTSQLDHYVKGQLTLMSDSWTGSLPDNPKTYDAAVVRFLAENYRTSLGKDVHFVNGVYYGNTRFSDKYWFMVLDYDVVYKLSSGANDATFKSYSAWLLKMVRQKGKIATMK